MKRIFLLVLGIFSLGSSLAFAGDLYFTIMENSVERRLGDTTVYISDNSASPELDIFINNASDSKTYSNLYCKTTVNSIAADPTNYSLCFGECLAASRITQTVQDNSDILAIYPTDDATGKYYISIPFHFNPNGVDGTSSFTLSVYSSTDLMAKATVNITFVVGASNVFENTEKFSKIFPSINSGEFSIQNENITPSSKYVVYSYSGSKADVNASLSSGSAKFNASSLSNGEYFIELYNDEKQIGAHKFIIAK